MAFVAETQADSCPAVCGSRLTVRRRSAEKVLRMPSNALRDCEPASTLRHDEAPAFAGAESLIAPPKGGDIPCKASGLSRPSSMEPWRPRGSRYGVSAVFRLAG